MLPKKKLNRSWSLIKIKLKEKFPELTEEDLMYSQGREDQLLEKIQQKTGKHRLEIEQEIDAILDAASR